MERKIGEVFECDGKRLQVAKDLYEMCKNCYFEGNECSTRKDERGECLPEKRKDRQNVFFKELGDSEEKEEKTILDEAKAIIKGNRQSDYGDPVESFDKIAKTASMIAGEDFSPKECCAVLMAVKIVRESFKHKRDNLVDLCGYAHIMNEINESEKKGEQDAD